ncbi:MAG: CBS domain-containing protein [Thalassolituus sp.]
MQTISDIMTTGVHTLRPESTLLDAEKLMREYKVRHIPVVDDENKVLGVLSQKEFLREAFRITDKFGAHHLQDYLAKTPVGDCLDKEVTCISSAQPLRDAGQALQQEKHGCLLIASEEKTLLGIVTSQDFVKLALSLL